MLIDYLQAVCVALGRETEMETGWYGAGADRKDRIAGDGKLPTANRALTPTPPSPAGPAVIRRRLRVLRGPLAQ